MAKKKKTEPKKVEPLTGEGLIHKVKELENLSKEEKAKACGYYTVTKNGVERVNMMQFLNALIDAEGIELDSTSKAEGRGGRSASYRTTVQSNGNLLIGSAYTKQLGVHPGDEFEINLGRKHIRLKQLEREEDQDQATVAAWKIMLSLGQSALNVDIPPQKLHGIAFFTGTSMLMPRIVLSSTYLRERSRRSGRPSWKT